MTSRLASDGLPPLALVPVASSDLEAVGYDEVHEILDVKFRKSGKTIRYYNVGSLIHSGLMAEDTRSKGIYFSRMIRNHYRSLDITGV